MKKAFEQNVSRAKPRLRLGALTGALDPADPTGTAAATPEPAAPEAPAPVAESPDLSSEVRSRIERRAGPRPTAAEAMEAALNAPPRHAAPPPAAQGLPAVTAPSFSPVSHALSALVSPEAARVEEEAPPAPWLDPDSQETAPGWNVAQESAPEESVWDADAVPPVSHREVAEAVAASAWNVSVAQQRESVVEAFGREPLGAEPTPTHVEPPPPTAARWDALTARPEAATHVDPTRVAPLAHSVTHTEALRAEVARVEPPAATRAEAAAPVPPQAEAPRADTRGAPVTFASPPPAMAQAEAPRGMPATFAGPPPGVQFDGRMGVQALRMPSEAEPMTTYAAVQASTVTTTETVARQEAAPAPVEVQTPAPPREDDSESRREKLKARLKAVRENPRPEPLPATVAEAGQRAVERITHLQAELTKVKAANLTLTQDLEVARRQAEKATEEARLRMDEARRLSAEMEGRVKLLADLERELASLEGERDEALLSLQESRQALQAAAKEHEALEQVVTKGKLALADSLAEEERLAVELEGAKDESASLRRAVETLQGERDVLAQQVASLTAERAELLEARKALESVHRALSQATVR
ncbi:hypothetical protein COCOR_00544 [Corallococcus coralloides DSM 2259]|uniref:Extensin-like protein n=1 Tax=Corallococcus coralloides (strain ATCC 25202 / DSM 2259 / NBRC 100086 / M2) TaxID=1144275 RepID=H8MEM0_CORCM|nr:hypothetical protein [Corallococcus coralloides]AFE03552.1 hypothetical protein COCOR_00544 [Corallococcus coralloides DSM 2259]